VFGIGQLDRHVGRGAHDTRGAVGVDAASEHRLQHQKELFGEHDGSHPKQYARTQKGKFKFRAAKAIAPSSSPAGGYRVVLSHLHQAGAAREAVDQAEDRPHDRTPLLITDTGDVGAIAFPGFFVRL
jgi:hypothetical protein